jgi:hypothetical protein
MGGSTVGLPVVADTGFDELSGPDVAMGAAAGALGDAGVKAPVTGLTVEGCVATGAAASAGAALGKPESAGAAVGKPESAGAAVGKPESADAAVGKPESAGVAAGMLPPGDNVGSSAVGGTVGSGVAGAGAGRGVLVGVIGVAMPAVGAAVASMGGCTTVSGGEGPVGVAVDVAGGSKGPGPAGGGAGRGSTTVVVGAVTPAGTLSCRNPRPCCSPTVGDDGCSISSFRRDVSDNGVALPPPGSNASVFR